MKTLILLFVVTSAFALTPNWKQIAKKAESAKNEKEFVALKKKYPDLLQHFGPKNLVQIVVTSVTWQFTGETTCEAGDARLKFTGRGVHYCNKQGAATVCTTSAPMSPWGDTDPCLYP